MMKSTTKFMAEMLEELKFGSLLMKLFPKIRSKYEYQFKKNNIFKRISMERKEKKALF